MSPVVRHIITQVNSRADLDALIGMHVTGETPEVVWADSHGHFQFGSEEEARDAVSDPYYRQFLPEVDWSQTVVEEVNVYRPYCSDPAVLWEAVEKASEKFGQLSVIRKQGRWWAAFGKGEKKSARTVPVAICLAALDAVGVGVDVDHDRLDADISRPQPEQGDDLRDDSVQN